nr:YadA-like family protein [Neisseria cinerea]
MNKSGFYVQQNGKSTLDGKAGSDKVSDTEKVTPNDVVNFVNGNGTVIKAVTTRDANGVDTTNVTFNVDMAEITPDSDGSVNGPVPQNLLDALDAAQAKVDENPDDEEAKKALEAAQDAVNKAGGNKVANAQNVADMINSSGFTLKTSATADGKKESGDDEIINPGKTVEMIAGKNLTVKQEANGKVTYSMKDAVEFTSVKVGDTQNGKAPVNFTTVKATDASNNDPANKPTTALNVSSSDGKPTQITGVGSTLNVKPVDTNTNGTPTADADKPKLVDLVGTDAAPVNKNAAATVGDLQNMGWVVSSDKATDAKGEYKDVVKNSNEVKFVGKGAAKVSGKTVNGVRTITVDVEAPDVKTAELVSNKDGSVIAPSTNPELQKALKAAKDELAALPKEATPEQKEAAENKVKAAETALNNAVDNKGVATAKNVADMINASGFTLKTSATADGKKDATSTGDEVINPGKAVEMVAGKNLTVKQEANGKVTYATKDDVSFNTVNVGSDNTYVDADGKPVTKNADGTYTDSKGQPIEEGKVTKLAPVAMKAEKAKPATNNGNKAEDQPTTALNVSSSDGKPTQITGVGSTLNVKPVDTNTNGTPTADADKPKLVDLVGTDAAPVNKNAAATVGDLQNMGWVVSTEKGNGYKDVVKNANQVEFKGTGLATVTGETKDGIRTITVNVDAQKAVEAIQTPVVYTNKDGNKLVKVGDKFYKAGDVVNGKPQENAKAVPNGDVIASMSNGDNNTSKPMQLANVGSNLPTVNDTNKQAFDPNSTTPKAGKDNKSAPITADEAAAIAKKAGNNAATVSDVLNAGWNLQNNGEARDFVKPYDTVNFVNGKGTTAVVETADNLTSTVKFDVDAGEITADTTKPGAVKGPVTADKAKKLADDLKKAEQAVKDLPADAPEDKKAEAQKALKDAQAAAAPLNKVATAKNVAEAINNSGWRTNSTTATGGAKDTLINPGKAVNFESGKNMKVAQTVDKDGNVAYTYATKDDVQFNSVQLGGDTGPKLTNDGKDLKVSGSNGTDPVKITNVADGNISADSKDAVNGSQLHATNQSINRLGDTVNNIGGNVTRLSDKVNNMDRDYRAGIAGSNAAASLPQVYLPGKSMVAAAAGTFKGQNALAVGYSSISDNGKLIWKAQANLNSRADVGVGVGMGYLW